MFIFVTFLAIWTFASQGLAQTGNFEAFQDQDSGKLSLRLDTLSQGQDGANLVGAEVSIDGGPAQELALARRPQFERTFVSVRAPLTQTAQTVRLRFISADGQGQWSEAQKVAQLPRGRSGPGIIPDDAWEWRPHPTLPDTLQLRLSALQNQDRLSGIAVRANWWDTQVVLPPISQTWLDLPLSAEDYGRGQQFDLYIAAVSGDKRARWTSPKPASLSWRGPPRAPDAPWSTDWLVRETGKSGEFLIEVLNPPPAHEDTLISIQARVTAVDDRFAPLNPLPDWFDLPFASPSQAGAVAVTGLTDGQLYTVELRGVSNSGFGRLSAPKIVTPRSFGFPTQVIVGDMNTAGQARVRIPKGVQITQGDGWRVIAGPASWDWLELTAKLDQTQSTVTLSNGQQIEVTRRQSSFVAETAEDLATFLAVPAYQKSGATLYIGAEWLDVQGIAGKFDGAFAGLDAPLTVLPREPDLGTQITGWTIGSRDPNARSGNIIMRDIDFVYPEALWTRAGRPREVSIIQTRFSRGPVSDLTFERVSVRSDAMPARLGYRQRILVRAADFEKAERVTFLDGEVSHIIYGLRVGLVDSLTRGNTMHHMIADPININMDAGAQGRDIVIEHNTAFDFMGDGFLLHGDGTHMWVHGGRSNTPARIERLIYRGNVIFPGWEGVRAPPTMSAFFKIAGFEQDLAVSSRNDHQLIRMDATEGPRIVSLPPLASTQGIVRRHVPELAFVVQKTDRSANPVILRAAPGETIGDTGLAEIQLTNPFQTLELRARSETSAWAAFPLYPALQGFYADDRGTELPGLEFEANILWGLSLRQISPGNRPQADASIHHNAILIPLPGDINGDGQWNMPNDGITRKAGQILVSAADPSVTVFANIAGRTELSDKEGATALAWDNYELRWSDRPGVLSALFPGVQDTSPPTPGGLVWFPETRAEAIAMARPAAGSEIAQMGAGPVSPDPAEDWWNFETGQRGDSAISGEFGLLSKDPADAVVSTQIDTLTLELNAPISEGAGFVGLYTNGRSDPVARWSVAGADPNVTIAGSRLILKLPAPLQDGVQYQVIANQGILKDAWGRSWAGLSSQDWAFTGSGSLRKNLLPTTDLTQPLWRASGLTIADSTLGPSMYQVTGTDKVNRLRFAFRVNGPGQFVLRFDYQVVSPGQTLISHLNGSDPFRIDWSKVPTGGVERIAPGLWGRRTDISAAMGAAPLTAFSAELILDPAILSSEIDLDLLRVLPVGGSIDIGRVSLVSQP